MTKPKPGRHYDHGTFIVGENWQALHKSDCIRDDCKTDGGVMYFPGPPRDAYCVMCGQHYSPERDVDPMRPQDDTDHVPVVAHDAKKEDADVLLYEACELIEQLLTPGPEHGNVSPKNTERFRDVLTRARNAGHYWNVPREEYDPATDPLYMEATIVGRNLDLLGTHEKLVVTEPSELTVVLRRDGSAQVRLGSLSLLEAPAGSRVTLNDVRDIRPEHGVWECAVCGVRTDQLTPLSRMKRTRDGRALCPKHWTEEKHERRTTKR